MDTTTPFLMHLRILCLRGWRLPACRKDGVRLASTTVPFSFQAQNLVSVARVSAIFGPSKLIRLFKPHGNASRGV
jgi:hypothetical protein